MPSKLYKIRVLQKVSQYVIALKTGIQQSRISLIENSLIKPKDEEMKRIADVLGVTVQDLFCENGEKNNEQ